MNLEKARKCWEIKLYYLFWKQRSTAFQLSRGVRYIYSVVTLQLKCGEAERMESRLDLPSSLFHRLGFH